MSEWKPIVSCPTDESIWLMRLPDGTKFLGRWSISQQRWQSGVQDKYKDVDKTINRTIWANLPEGTYPSEYRGQISYVYPQE